MSGDDTYPCPGAVLEPYQIVLPPPPPQPKPKPRPLETYIINGKTFTFPRVEP